MKVTFLGTGGAFTDFRVNYHNNLLVECGLIGPPGGTERYILIDCGATAVQSLKERGIKPWQVQGVIVTHLHGDHIAGIEQLLWERYYTGSTGPEFRKTSLYAPAEVLRGLRASLEGCVNEYTDATGVARSGGYSALVQERAVIPDTGYRDDPTLIGNMYFRWHETPHVSSPEVNKPAYGIEMFDIYSSRTEKIYYTSDTTFRSQIGELFPDADIIFHDCTFAPPL